MSDETNDCGHEDFKKKEFNEWRRKTALKNLNLDVVPKKETDCEHCCQIAELAWICAWSRGEEDARSMERYFARQEYEEKIKELERYKAYYELEKEMRCTSTKDSK